MSFGIGIQQINLLVTYTAHDLITDLVILILSMRITDIQQVRLVLVSSVDF